MHLTDVSKNFPVRQLSGKLPVIKTTLLTEVVLWVTMTLFKLT